MISPLKHLTLAALAAIAALLYDSVAHAAPPTYPLKPSANNRYLVDQNDTPFLMVGDSPQALIGNLSKAQAAQFMSNRRQYGVNTLWINLLCASYTACNQDGTTYDGIAPFTGLIDPLSPAGPSNYDLSKRNDAYFQRVEDMLTIAANHGMVVLLDPIETGSWLATLQANGMGKARAYGRYLGNRFKDIPNIVWMHGNDFQSWRNASDNALVVAVAKGIQETDPNHIQTAELDYLVSATLDDPQFRPLVALDAVYTYRPTYAKILSEYRRASFKPMFMVEANYEFEQNGGTDGGIIIKNLRKQEYWTMLSGATGQLYGSAYTWRLDGDWPNNLDTPGIIQFNYMRRLFAPRQWYNLVPDRTHQVFTAGRGTFSDSDSITTDTYATAAATPDGTLAIAYLPTIRTVTVNLSKFSGPVRARWYDPTSGIFKRISGSPFVANGPQTFTPSGNNSDGDDDWVLVLDVD